MFRILVKLLLIFVLVYAGVSIWYERLEEKLGEVPVARQAAVPVQPEKKTEILRKGNDYTIIVDRNIFQAVLEKTEEKQVEEVAPVEPAPTKLKLSLMGTIYGSERDARAIISDDTKRQQDIYQVGDSLQGAMIKSIERGKVVLVVNGRDEVLTLRDREGGGPAYQPSPADYYREPAEPEAQPDTEVQQTPTRTPTRRPAVRPRPVRRAPVQRNQGAPQPEGNESGRY